jgi:hypothetical protein
MANVVKKHSVSYQLAQKMVDAAVAKARELGVSENVAILLISVTMRRLNVIGHLTTFSTAIILSLAERACSISSRASAHAEV